MGKNNSKLKTQQEPEEPKQPEPSEPEEQAEEMYLDEPWRKYEVANDELWNKEFRKKLIEGIQSISHLENVGRARIALFGIVSSGKSSFLNSISCIDKNRIVGQANIGASDESLTRTLSQFLPKNLGNNFTLLDTMGMEAQESGIDMNETKHVMIGNLPIGHKFRGDEILLQKDKKNPVMQDMAHCIVIVMDAQLIDNQSISDAHLKKIEILQKHARDTEVRTILLLTKIDLVCPELATDLTKVFKSKRMRDIAKLAEGKLKLPLMQIFPVKNYAAEQVLDLHVDILLLLALRQMVRFANDRIDYVADQKPTTSDQTTTPSDQMPTTSGQKPVPSDQMPTTSGQKAGTI